MDRRWSPRQPLSPLGSGFRWCGASECQMAPKGLGLLCALMPPGQTEPPPFQEVPIVAWQKSLFLAFCVHAYMWFACECVFASIRSACHVPGLSVDEVSRWVLGIAEQAVQRNGESSVFLHVFEQSQACAACPCWFCSRAWQRPQPFPKLPLPAFLLLHLLLWSSFLTHCLAIGLHRKRVWIYFVFWLSFWMDIAFTLERQNDDIRLNCVDRCALPCTDCKSWSNMYISFA